MSEETNPAAAVLLIIGVLFLAGLLYYYLDRQMQEARRRFRESLSDPETQKALLTLGGLLLAGWTAKKGFEFLKGIDWESIGAKVREVLEKAAQELDDLPDATSRLARARELLMTGGDMQIDEAALLASATLELGLKKLARRHGVDIRGHEADGLVGLASRLRFASCIGSDEERSIRHYAAAVRNRVMHGEFGKLGRGQVQNLINFVSQIIGRHNIT